MVSIIIPCFNVSDFIEECLSSAFSQTHKDIEVIAIDNNSTDGTFEKLLELQLNKYSSLIILQETKKGACAARNKGLSVAKGEWVQFLDADDIIDHSKILHQLNLIQNTKCSFSDVAFVSAAYQVQNTNGIVYKSCDVDNSSSFLNVFIRKSGITSSNLFSKFWVDKVKGWDENLTSSQETDLMMRMLLAGGNSINDQTPLTIIRERRFGQISQSNPTIRWQNIIKYRLSYLEEISQKFPDVYSKINAQCVSFLVSSIIILAKYDITLATKFSRRLSNYKSLLLPLYGLNKKSILFIKLLGLSGFLKFKHKLSR